MTLVSWYKKGLVVAITILFIGVGIQPVFASNVSINESSNIEKNCLECKPVNRLDLLTVKLLLIRVEAITNIILSKYRHIPEITEKYEEVLDIIDYSRVLDYPIICGILLILYNTFSSLYEILVNIILNHRTLYLIFFPILFPIGFAITYLMIITEIRGLQLNCKGFHLP